MCNREYGLGLIKINKKTGEVVNHKYYNPEKKYYTASMIKIAFAGLFLEYCEDTLGGSTSIPEGYKMIGGILDSVDTKNSIPYEILLTLMITISDNTATNIIFSKLEEKIGDINKILYKKFGCSHTKVFDLVLQKDKTYIKGSGESTPQEFLKILEYFLFNSKQAKTIRNIMSYQYLGGRGLRYIDKKIYLSSGNKTGQLDNMINDCGYIEDNNYFYLYAIFFPVEKHSPFEYQIENHYYKQIGKIIKKELENI